LINYIGRSESWVRTAIMPTASEWNCHPSGKNSEPVDISESVLVACALPPEQYEAQPWKQKARGKNAGTAVLPWLDGLCWSTGELFTSRRTEPPVFQYVPYLRPSASFDSRPKNVVGKVRRRAVNGVLYALESTVPAPVTATIEVAEQVHRKLMGIHRRLVGNPDAISERFTGKDSSGSPLQGHRHCFILPQDRDRDGLARPSFSHLPRYSRLR
jgi:hypothetical protein